MRTCMLGRKEHKVRFVCLFMHAVGEWWVLTRTRMLRRKQHKLRCWVEVVEEDGGGFICTWDGGCAYGAMEWE